VLVFCVFYQGVFAEDAALNDSKGFKFDAGAGLSFGLMQKTDDSTANAFGGLVTFLATLRGSFHGTCRYAFNDYLSVGGRVGVYTITYSSGDSSTTLYDFPVHAVVRGQWKLLAAELFGGYYISPVKSDVYSFSGPEFGGKVFLGPIYGSYSFVAASPKYNRVELGLQISDIGALFRNKKIF